MNSEFSLERALEEVQRVRDGLRHAIDHAGRHRPISVDYDCACQYSRTLDSAGVIIEEHLTE